MGHTFPRLTQCLLLAASVACNRGLDKETAEATLSATADSAAAGEGERCEMTVTGPASVEPGQPDHATVSLGAKSGYRINEEAPVRVTVDSSDLELLRSEFSAEEAATFASEEVKVEVPFTAHSEGPTSLEVHARYGVCDDENCAICRERRQLDTLSK